MAQSTSLMWADASASSAEGLRQALYMILNLVEVDRMLARQIMWKMTRPTPEQDRDNSTDGR